MKNRLQSSGFTLIEILVVVTIIGILAAIVVPRIMDRPDQARIVAAQTDVRAILGALKLYRLDNGSYPTSEQGLRALVTKPTSQPLPRNWNPNGYLEKMPQDPWQAPYLYLNPGLHGEIDVFTLGADGAVGGDGANADIGNWTLP